MTTLPDLQDLYDPATWDAVRDHISIERLETLGSDPLVLVRRAQLLIQQRRFQEALEALDRVDHPPAAGLRRLARVGLGLYERVAAQGYSPRGSSPLHLEEALYGEGAVGDALSALGRHDEALVHLRRAEYLACLLALKRRIPFLRTNTLRVQGLAGELRPSAIRREIARMQNPLAIHFAHRTLAEHLIGVGDYVGARGAARAAGHEALEAFLRALLGEPLERVPPEPLGLLAKIYAGVIAGQGLTTIDDVPGLHEPFTHYLRLVRAGALIRSGASALGVSLLRAEMPLIDQRVWRAAVKLRAVGDGEAVALGLQPGQVAEELRANIGLLAVREHVLNIVAWCNPEVMAMAAFDPEADSTVTEKLFTMPLLLGDTVRLGSRVAKVPERLGRALLAQGLGVPYDDVHDEHKRRYKARLKAAGIEERRVVNLGWVYRLIWFIWRDQGSLRAPRWREALRGLAALSPTLNRLLEEYPLSAG